MATYEVRLTVVVTTSDDVPPTEVGSILCDAVLEAHDEVDFNIDGIVGSVPERVES